MTNGNPQDRRKIENILREQLTRHRLTLNMKLRAAENAENPTPFTLEDLRAFVGGIKSNDPNFLAEVNNVMQGIEHGATVKAPVFDTPEKQLVWGAALSYLALNPSQMQSWAEPLPADTPVSQSPLWKQVTGTRIAYQELMTHAHHVREALRDKNTRYSWGEPGVGFSFDRQKNHINIDIVQSMIVGFEHARADVYREIGASLLSISYPKRMQDVYREMQPYLKKVRLAKEKKGPQLKPEEYKKLRMLSAEWELRHMMFAAAEENTTNRFVSNMGRQNLQDYSVSINNTGVTFRGIGLTRIPQQGQVSDELRAYMNLCNTVQLSFFQNNSFFDNDENGWARVGVETGMVRKIATRKKAGGNPDQDGINHADFKALRELCGGPKGLEHLQPKQSERLYGWQNLTGRLERACEDRKAIIEEIWDLYAEDLIQAVLKQANDQIDEQLKEAQEKQKQDGEKQDGDDQDGEDQDGDDGQEQEGQGQGQGQGQGKGKGKPQKGQKPQPKQKQDRNRPQGEQQDPDDADGDGKGEKSDKKDKNKKDGKGEKGEKQDGDDQDGEGQDGAEERDGQKGEKQGKGEKAEGKLGADDKDTVPVEGAGDMAAPEAPTGAPADELDPNGSEADGEGQDGEGQDADGEGSDADGDDNDGEGQDGESVEDMEKAIQDLDEQEAEGDEAEADGEDADGEGQGKGKGQKSNKPGKGEQPGKGAGHSNGKSLKELSEQSWHQYNDRIAELAGPIARVRKLFKDVQDRQLQKKTVQSKDLDILPENGELKDRFNAEAHRDFTIKKALGNVEENDLKRFHKDQTNMVPTEIDIVIAIDGSGSMTGVPLNSALQASAIMYEAAAGKDMKMNIYVVVWGPNDPPVIIKPGDDRAAIGRAMESARKGLSSGTDLAPAIKKVAQTIGEQRGRAGTLSGFTHVLVVSDGDMFDAEKAKANIATMFDYSDKVTFDAAIITGSSGTNMQKMAKDIKGRKPYQDVGIVVGKDPETVPMSMVGLLLDKVRKCGSFVAVPNTKKRRAMKKAHKQMDKKP